MILSLDFETRSTVDLRRTGVYPYAEHVSTGVWCCSWALDDGPVSTWLPGHLVPPEWYDALAAGAEFRAWNAQFERVIWHKHCVPTYGFPEVPLELWHDTAAEAAAMSLPRSLGHAAEVLGVSAQKDKEGHNLMMRMARPRSFKNGQPVWWNDPEKLQRLIEYCEQDVLVERAIYAKLRRLSKQERAVYLLDQTINDRGFAVDHLLVQSARDLADKALDRANGLIASLTDGEVDAVTKNADLARWLQYKGLAVDNVKKSTVRELLESDVGGEARQVLEIRAEAARTSVAKLDAFDRASCADGRIRGSLLYHGASTGRWSGRLVQPQNFPRPEVDDIESFIPAVIDGEYDVIDAKVPPLVLISSMLRSMIVASEDCTLMAADYNAIEARVTAWLAGERDLVQQFAEDQKVYERMASRVYAIDLGGIGKDSAERTLGKATVLGCGFGMGGEKFQRAAFEQYGLKITRAFADDVVATYRNTYPAIPKLWRQLDAAVMNAVREPGSVCFAGYEDNIRVMREGSYLWVSIPSRRLLAYPLPRITSRMTPWGEERPSVVAWGIDSYTRKWKERALYGGLITENIVQATARDLLAASMQRVERAGYPVVLSVHDEIICDVPQDDDHDFNDFLSLMHRKPRWADGCPIKVEGWEGNRYRK